jgi:hypothetical protein
MIEVGHVPIAVGRAQDPGHDAALGPDPGEGVGDRVGAQHLGPLTQLLLHRLHLGLRQGGHLGGPAAGEPRQCVHPHPVGVGRPAQRVEEPAHVVGGLRLQHAAATGHDGGDPPLGQGGVDVGGVGVPADQHGDVGRAHRPAVTGAGAGVGVGVGEEPVVEEPGRLVHQVGVDGLGGRTGEEQLVVVLLPGDAGVDGQSQREGGQGLAVVAPQVPAPIDGGLAHRHERDVGAAEGGSVEQHVQRRQHRVVGAPVGEQRPSRCRRSVLDRPEVGVHIGTTERVDGLLGVPHQDQCRPAVRPVEQGREDLPLDRVGVLELIDQCHPEAAPEGGHRALAARAAERVAQLGEHVVEAERPALPAAQGHQLHAPLHQTTEQDGGRRGTGLVR